MKKLLTLILTLATLSANAQAQQANYDIIPQPKSVQTDTTQFFRLQPEMTIEKPQPITETV